MNSEFQKPDEQERNLALAFSFLFCFTIYVLGQLLRNLLLSVFIDDAAIQQNKTLIDTTPDSSSSTNKDQSKHDSRLTIASQSLTPSMRQTKESSDSTLSTQTQNQQNLQEQAVLKNSSQLHITLQDGLRAFIVCTCSLENGLVLSCLGFRALLAAISLHGIVNTQLAWKDSYGSPCNAFYRYLNGRRTTLYWVLASWMCQLLAAFAALQTSYAWWGMRVTTYHSNLLDSKLAILHRVSKYPELEGVGDLKVPVSTGMLIEGGAAFFDILLAGLLTAAMVGWRRISGRGETEFLLEAIVFTIKQTVSLYILAQGLPLTGLYVNPVNAVIQTWGLGNAQPMTHLLVYWLSPMLGIWTAYHLVNRLITIPLCSPMNLSSIPPLGALVLEENELSRPHSTYANIQTESDPQLLFANVDPTKKIRRCRSQTRAGKPPTGVVWRRSSECRFLPHNLGDSVCRRCPVLNSTDDSVSTPISQYQVFDHERSLL